MDNNVKRLRPHEQRVVEEHAELDVRGRALSSFLGTPLFKRLDIAEQGRLYHQYDLMVQLQNVLDQRIKAFPPIPDNDPIITAQPVVAETAAEPISDVDMFAMRLDEWHSTKIEQGNRLLEIPEGTTIEVEDITKPGEIIAMDLNGAYLQVFRVGVETVLHLFKDLPFGASIEEAEDQGVADAAG